MIDVAWNMTVLDIEKTLRASIGKIFGDMKADKGVKIKMALGLIILG
jgi:hypothetical protein